MDFLGGVCSVLDAENLTRASNLAQNSAQVFNALEEMIPKSPDATALRNLRSAIPVSQIAPPQGLEAPILYNG